MSHWQNRCRPEIRELDPPSPLPEQLRAGDAYDDHRHETGLDQAHLVAEEDHAADDDADRAQAGPDSVGRAGGNGAHGEREEGHVEEAQGDGDDRRLPTGDGRGPFEAQGPADFSEDSDAQDQPRHACPSFLLAGSGKRRQAGGNPEEAAVEGGGGRTRART